MKGFNFLNRDKEQKKGKSKKSAKGKGKKGTQRQQANPIVRYFRQTRSEVKKVTWPTRKEAINLTVIVVAVTMVMSVAMGMVDFIFAQLFNFILAI